MEQLIEQARRFNRFYTRAVGVLGDGYLGSAFSLAEARVLYELAQAKAPIAAEIGADLGLDPGYLSRILKRFESQGLLRRERAEDDRRQARLALTEAGRAAFAELEAGAQRSMGGLLAPLSPDAQAQVAEAMARIQALLGASPRAGVVLRAPQAGDLGWVIARHAILYGREQGWAPSFEALVAEIIVQMQKRPEGGRGWIAERGGERLGCVFLAREDETTARLRLLLVEPAARGLGLGRRLTEAAIDFARAAGYREVVLWTHAQLTAARRIYADLGFQKEAEWTHEEFGPPVVSETWRLAL